MVADVLTKHRTKFKIEKTAMNTGIGGVQARLPELQISHVFCKKCDKCHQGPAALTHILDLTYTFCIWKLVFVPQLSNLSIKHYISCIMVKFYRSIHGGNVLIYVKENSDDR